MEKELLHPPSPPCEPEVLDEFPKPLPQKPVSSHTPNFFLQGVQNVHDILCFHLQSSDTMLVSSCCKYDEQLKMLSRHVFQNHVLVCCKSFLKMKKITLWHLLTSLVVHLCCLMQKYVQTQRHQSCIFKCTQGISCMLFKWKTWNNFWSWKRPLNLKRKQTFSQI